MTREFRTNHQIAVRATIPVAMHTLTAFSDYPSFVPGIRRAEVVSQNEGTWDVRFHLKLLTTIVYTLRLASSQTRLSWELVHGDFMVENSGFWELTEEHEGCLLQWDSKLVLRGHIIPSLMKRLLHSGVPDTCNAFKNRMESSGVLDLPK